MPVGQEEEDFTVQVLGYPVRCGATGEGPPILLVHGLGASRVAWRDTVRSLAERYRVYTPDLLGHGDSGKPEIVYDLDNGVRFICELLDVLGERSAALVGNSMGGVMALKTAIDYPDRVNELVLVNSVGLGRELSLPIRLASLPLIGEFIEGPWPGGTRALLKNVFYDAGFATPELVQALDRTRKLPGAKRAVLDAIRRGVTPFGLRRNFVLLDGLSHLRVPLLIVWGAEDRVIPVEHAYRAKRLLPTARLEIFSRCGHWPQIERAEDFNRVLLDFLSAPGA